MAIASRGLPDVGHPGPPARPARVRRQDLQPAAALPCCPASTTPSAASRPSRAEAAVACFTPLRTLRFGFDAEVLVRARRLGWTIAEVPVRWRHVEASRVSARPRRARMLFDLLRLRFGRLDRSDPRPASALESAGSRLGAVAPSTRLWPLGLYTALSLLFWGPWVLGEPARDAARRRTTWTRAPICGSSPGGRTRSGGPRSLLHRADLRPGGLQPDWVTSMPGPSLLLAPLTLAAGPVAHLQPLIVRGARARAWTAYLLCRHVTGSMPASLAGGYVFGFSPYMLSQLRGAPQLALDRAGAACWSCSCSGTRSAR